MYTEMLKAIGSSGGSAVPSSTGAKSGSIDNSTGISSGGITFGGKDNQTIMIAIGALVLVVLAFTRKGGK